MTIPPKPFKSPNPDEFWLDERIYIREIMNAPEEPDISLARFRVPAGSTTQLHALTISEWYIMESGTGIVEVDGHKIEMSAGDNIKINPGQSQRVINMGAEELVFQSICTPRWTHECYKNLEGDDT
ncbi:MAG: cupin [Robiginitomaculum sp.]|nr:MAG: cupin [Robiginitomaculum sp.]